MEILLLTFEELSICWKYGGYYDEHKIDIGYGMTLELISPDDKKKYTRWRK